MAWRHISDDDKFGNRVNSIATCSPKFLRQHYTYNGEKCLKFLRPKNGKATFSGKATTTQKLDIIPQVVTVSQGWSGWRDEGSIWTLPPTEFETLLRQAKGFVETLPKEQLSGRMIILDNWNEWDRMKLPTGNGWPNSGECHRKPESHNNTISVNSLQVYIFVLK